MARKRRYRGKKRKGRIVIKEQVTLAHKNDATRVANVDTMRYRKAPTVTNLPTNGITFKVKMRKK